MTSWLGYYVVLLAAAILLGAPTQCWASGCIASATPIAFGTYQPLHSCRRGLGEHDHL